MEVNYTNLCFLSRQTRELFIKKRLQILGAFQAKMLHKVKLHILSRICNMKGKSSKNTFWKSETRSSIFSSTPMCIFFFSSRKLPKTSKGALSKQENGRWRDSKPLEIEFLKFLISLFLLYKCNFFSLHFSILFFLRSSPFPNLIKTNNDRLTEL